MDIKPWYKQKTTWTGVSMMVAAILPVFTSLSPQQIAAIGTVLGGLGLIFLRQGVEGSK